MLRVPLLCHYKVKNELKNDFQYFSHIDVETAIPGCERLIDKYQLNTLDSIQLSSALDVITEIEGLVCCDNKLLEAAEKENVRIINPLEE